MENEPVAKRPGYGVQYGGYPAGMFVAVAVGVTAQIAARTAAPAGGMTGAGALARGIANVSTNATTATRQMSCASGWRGWICSSRVITSLL